MTYINYVSSVWRNDVRGNCPKQTVSTVCYNTNLSWYPVSSKLVSYTREHWRLIAYYLYQNCEYWSVFVEVIWKYNRGPGFFGPQCRCVLWKLQVNIPDTSISVAEISTRTISELLYTYHDLCHRKENREEGVQSTVAVFNARLTLQSSAVHPDVPVCQFVDEFYQSRHDGVQTISCDTSHRTDACRLVDINAAFNEDMFYSLTTVVSKMSQKKNLVLTVIMIINFC